MDMKTIMEAMNRKKEDPEKRLAEQKKELEEALKDLDVGNMSFAEGLEVDEEGYKPITWNQLRRFFSYEKPAKGFKLHGDISQRHQEHWERSKYIHVRDSVGDEGAVFFYDDNTEPYFSYEDVIVGNKITIRNPRYHRFMDGQEGMRIDEAKNIACIKKSRYSDASRIDYGQLNKANGNKKFEKEKYEDAISCYDAAIKHLEGTFYEEPEKEQEAKELVASCHLNIAACFIKEQQWKKVEAPCRRALKVNAGDKQNAKAYYRMGLAFVEEREFTTAAEALKKAIELAPGDAAVTKEIDRLNELRHKDYVAQKEFVTKMKQAQAKPFGYKPRFFGGEATSTLDGVCNFREVGGLLCESGDRRVRRHMLYRSANLTAATPEDMSVLVGELGLKTVIDLRTGEEVAAAVSRHKKRSVKAAADYKKLVDAKADESTEEFKQANRLRSFVDVHSTFLPVIVKCEPNRVPRITTPYVPGKSREDILAGRVSFQVNLVYRAVMSMCSWWVLLRCVVWFCLLQMKRAARLMVQETALRVGVTEFYKTILAKQGPEIAKVLDLACDPSNYPLLVCCSMGKDRTGIIVALLLSAVGVPDETIVADYARTSENVSLEMREAQEQLGLSADWNVAHPETMRELLRTIRKESGSTAQYLKKLGITDAALATLRETLTQPYTPPPVVTCFASSEGGDTVPPAAQKRPVAAPPKTRRPAADDDDDEDGDDDA